MTTPDKAVEDLEQLLSSAQFARALEHRHFKRFLDDLPIAVAISKLIGEQQRIVYVNRAFEKVTGWTSPELAGKPWSILDSYRHVTSPDILLGQAVLAGEDVIGVFKREGSDKPTLVEASVAAINSDGEADRFRLLALIDTSEGHRLREELERSLREKDLLLRELQHRVKNSLQLVAALIRIEARNAREGKAVNMDSVASRVEALGILYRSLSDMPGGEQLDLGNYLSQIASAAMRSHAKEGIRLELKVDCCPTSINLAMPAGLVVNEAITNALKHAFVGRESGTIELKCLRRDDGCHIEIADDGVGLPAGLVWPSPNKISALIVQSLYENSRAVLNVETAPGEGTRISFLLPFQSVSTDESAVLPFTVVHSLMQLPHDAQSGPRDQNPE